MTMQVVTFSSSGPCEPYTITSGNPEATRLVEVLRDIRPPDGLHDHLCDSQPGDPDRWVEDGGFEGYAVQWVLGVGLVTSDERVVHPPSASWCCGSARLRQEIDAALKVEVE